jgi:hypothetical protein
MSNSLDGDMLIDDYPGFSLKVKVSDAFRERIGGWVYTKLKCGQMCLST